MKNLKKLKDEQIVELVRSKDKELFVEIVVRYEAKLLRYAIYMIRDKAKAADAVQESFIKAYINLNGFDLKMKFSSWIYRIVHNQVINTINKNKREMPLFDNVDFKSDSDIEAELTKKEIKVNLDKCIGQIPIIYSEPLTLYFLDDKSYEEISDILRIPISTVGTRISRAKVIIKKICQNVK